MGKSTHKKLDTRGHFRDFFHRASSLRNDKRIANKRERRMLKTGMHEAAERAAEQETWHDYSGD